MAILADNLRHGSLHSFHITGSMRVAARSVIAPFIEQEASCFLRAGAVLADDRGQVEQSDTTACLQTLHYRGVGPHLSVALWMGQDRKISRGLQTEELLLNEG